MHIYIFTGITDTKFSLSTVAGVRISPGVCFSVCLRVARI